MLKEYLKNSYPMQQRTETRCKSFGFDGRMIYCPLMKPTTLIMSLQWKNKRWKKSSTIKGEFWYVYNIYWLILKHWDQQSSLYWSLIAWNHCVNTDCFATHSCEFCLFRSFLLRGKTSGIRGFADSLGSVGFAVYDLCMLAQQRSLKCVSQSPCKRVKNV